MLLHTPGAVPPIQPSLDTLASCPPPSHSLPLCYVPPSPLQTVDVQAKFVNGKPDKIEVKYVMRSSFEWDR